MSCLISNNMCLWLTTLVSRVTQWHSSGVFAREFLRESFVSIIPWKTSTKASPRQNSKWNLYSEMAMRLFVVRILHKEGSHHLIRNTRMKYLRNSLTETWISQTENLYRLQTNSNTSELTSLRTYQMTPTSSSESPQQRRTLMPSAEQSSETARSNPN